MVTSDSGWAPFSWVFPAEIRGKEVKRAHVPGTSPSHEELTMANSWNPNHEHHRFGASLGRAGFSRSTASERTYEELYEEAKRRNITGRSKMSKTELERALGGR